MNTLAGLLFIAAGAFCQSSSYVPINKVREWSWESFWLSQGVFAWIIFPLIGALLAMPSGTSLIGIYEENIPAFLNAAGFGVLWGIGGLFFGLAMRYLGVAMGQSVGQGICAAVGTLLPVVLAGENLFRGKGLILLIGVSLTIAGVVLVCYAGSLRAGSMTEEQKRKAIKDFALTKGLFVAILAGIVSSCFNFGLEAGKPLVAINGNKLLASLPATLAVTLGGSLTNIGYCLFQNKINHSFSDYRKSDLFLKNLPFCVLAGFLWYSQFLGLSMGKSFFAEGSVLLPYAWCILMSLCVFFSNFWGIVLNEWKGCSPKTIIVLILGLIILIFSLVFPNL